MSLLDTHCHLQDPRLAAGLDGLLDRARCAGVTHMVCCGTREADWPAVRALADRCPAVLPMLGLHPWYAEAAAPGWLERLGRDLESCRAGMGECGLDFALEDSDREVQEAAFRAQVRLAKALDRPLSIHCRRAWERLSAILREEGLPPAGAVIHAFSGSPEVAVELQRLGCHLAFGSSLTRPGNRRSPRALVAVAPDRLLFETDAPDLPPDGAEASEPADLPRVLEAAARIRGELPERLAALVQANALQVFGGLIP